MDRHEGFDVGILHGGCVVGELKEADGVDDTGGASDGGETPLPSNSVVGLSVYRSRGVTPKALVGPCT